MAVIIGSARRDENGRYTGGKAGDQLQGGSPDYSGEVSMQDFYVHKKGWYVIRPKENAVAGRISALMTTACNNPNIGYDQGNRNAILKNGIHSSVLTECDCSSLVRECVKEASGIDPGPFDTSGEISRLENTGLFQPAIIFISLSATPLYAGDILVTRSKGHTAVVVNVDGVVRSETQAYSNPYAATEDAGEFPTFIGYEPRLSAPVTSPKPKKGDKDIRDLYFVPIPDDGYSPFYNLNNRSYAWGRFSEIMDQPCNIGLGLPSSWFEHIEDGYERNVAATLGSIMVFTKPGTQGYAAIVERIDPEGAVYTSEVTASGQFALTHRVKRYGSWDWVGPESKDEDDTYKFEGFIHNPAVGQLGVAESALETFVRIAEEHVGDGPEWACGEMGLTPNNGWSAAFITACSKTAGSSLNIIIPNVISCSAIGRVGVLRNMGTWHKGPAQGSYTAPQVGDIVLFRNKLLNTKVETYQADSAGIVTKASYNNMTVVRGDDGDRVRSRNYEASSAKVSGFFRPNWDLIDGTTDSVNQYRTIEGLYTNGVAITDACAREVCYLSGALKPSINQSKIKLSPINYTGLLANMYSVFAQSSTSDAADSELVVDLWTNTIKSYYQSGGLQLTSSTSIMSQLLKGISSVVEAVEETLNLDTSGNPSITFSYLKGKGLSAAAAIGIMGNIQAESHFNTSAVGDHGTSFGICQWHNDRGRQMKEYVGSNWKTNLTGQLDFLLYELQNKKGYSSTWSKIQTAPNTIGGAQQVADKFVRNFEVPANVESEALKRMANAADFWKQLV